MSERKKQIEEAARKLDDEHLQYLEEILTGKREQGTGWKYFERFVDANPPAPTQDDELHIAPGAVEKLMQFVHDERDAETYATSEGADLEGTSHRSSVIRHFLAGRKGMVPAAEVERLKKLVEDLSEPFDAVIDRACASERAAQLQLRKHYVAEAVKAKRERCIEVMVTVSEYTRDDLRMFMNDETLLNPPPEGGER